MAEMNVILRGINGSMAYGLDREGSDIDRFGFFVAPTVEVAGLDWEESKNSKVTTKPDVTLHEIGKGLRLMLKGNPTVVESLWLPLSSYEVLRGDGAALLKLRKAFLSTPTVKTSYGGYARQQMLRLRTRADGTFSSETRKRTTKHARHLLRLFRQGRELMETGELTIRVANPEDYWAFDTMTIDQVLEVYREEEALFDEAARKSVLQDAPDTPSVAKWLAGMRRKHLG